MVFGTPITGTPSFCNPCPILREPSPPMTMSESSPWSLIFSTTLDETSLTVTLPSITDLCAKGFPRLVVPKIVPPWYKIPRVFQGLSGRVLVGGSRPSKPSKMPITSQPYLITAVLTTARITAFSPGASPPPDRMPIRMEILHSIKCGQIISSAHCALRGKLFQSQQPRSARGCNGNHPGMCNAGLLKISQLLAIDARVIRRGQHTIRSHRKRNTDRSSSPYHCEMRSDQAIDEVRDMVFRTSGSGSCRPGERTDRRRPENLLLCQSIKRLLRHEKTMFDGTDPGHSAGNNCLLPVCVGHYTQALSTCFIDNEPNLLDRKATGSHDPRLLQAHDAGGHDFYYISSCVLEIKNLGFYFFSCLDGHAEAGSIPTFFVESPAGTHDGRLRSQESPAFASGRGVHVETGIAGCDDACRGESCKPVEAFYVHVDIDESGDGF